MITKKLSLILVLTFTMLAGIVQAQKSEKGIIVLFDGTDMDAWQGNTTEYVLEDGCIVMRPTQEMGGNLYSKEQSSDFVLRFEFLLTPGANNGLRIRHDIVPDDQRHRGRE